MKTPTPEEFLTKAEGFPNSSLNDGKVRLTRPKMIELMRDYAEAYHKAELEKFIIESNKEKEKGWSMIVTKTNKI